MEYKDRCSTYHLIANPVKRKITIKYTEHMADHPEDLEHMKKQIALCINRSFNTNKFPVITNA